MKTYIELTFCLKGVEDRKKFLKLVGKMKEEIVKIKYKDRK